MGRKSGIFSRFRMFIARASGRVDNAGNLKPHERGDTFKLIIALMLALVTILGAVVAWRSAVASTFAGNTEDDGILASLNLQEATTTGSLQASQNRAAHIEYFHALKLANAEIDQALAGVEGRTDLTQAEIDALLRPIIEKADLALTNKLFLDARYLTESDGYDAGREQAEYLAEAAQAKDLDPEPQFAEADKYRAKSVALIATLIVLAISLWFFAFAEVLEHPAKYVMALGGLALIVAGGGAAWAIEGGADLPNVYHASELTSIITGIGILIATLVLISLTLIRRRTPQPTHDPAANTQYAIRNTQSEGQGEERFRQVVTMLIASATVFAAIVGWLQADSGAKGDQAIRDAQRFASDALGKESTGRALVNFQYGTAYRTWDELLVQALSAEAAGDSKTAELYRNVMTETLKLGASPANPAAQDQNSELKPQNSNPDPQLLAAPYFDANNGAAPDLAGYESDVYVTKRAELSERSDLAGSLNNAWESKSNAYIVHLTLLAAALALFGLSLSFSGLARPLFVTVGLAISLVTSGSVFAVYSEPVTYVPDSAVAAYARGLGLIHRQDALGAVAAYDDALKQAPGYANALAGRGEAHLALGSPEGNIAAAKDYEAAQTSGKDDAKVAWNLGWIYYLQGRFDDSIKMSRHSLDLAPRQSGVLLNLAIAELAAGKIDDAKAEYKAAMDKVTQQVAELKAANKPVPPSLWLYLDAGGRDLESLSFRLIDTELAWIEAPPKSAVQNPATVQDAAREMFQALKSLVTSLENTGRPPENTLAAMLDPFAFGAKASRKDEAFTFAESFASPVKEVEVKYKFSGMQNGQNVEYKVFFNGVERPEFRTKVVWDKGESGEAEQSLTGDLYAISNLYSLDPGDYIVEMYVENTFAQIGGFDIKP